MPPFDPRQIIIEATVMNHVSTFIVAFLIALLAYKVKRGSIFLYTLATCIALTSPMLGLATEAVWGAYPTIDKEGSLLFYRDGVHHRLFSFSDPAHRLIGFHLGHLWISQILDWFVGDIGAFNLQALLNVSLTWYCTYRLLHLLGATRLWAWLLASQMGLHLHLFRDIQFYTIEKSAIYPLLMFWEAFIRAAKGEKKAPLWMGVSFLLASWINLYWGIFCVLMTGPFLWIYRRENRNCIIKGIGCCILFGIGIGIYQQLLTISGPPFAHSDQFMKRAALDNVTLWPPSWNRLPWYASISPLIVICTIWAWFNKYLMRTFIGFGCLFFILSLGPYILEEVPNPIYQGLTALPALWRFAKPEAFFFLSFIAILTSLVRINPSKKIAVMMGLLFLMQWCGIRTHKEYPSYFSEPIQTTLPKNWERRVFQEPSKVKDAAH